MSTNLVTFDPATAKPIGQPSGAPTGGGASMVTFDPSQATPIAAQQPASLGAWANRTLTNPEGPEIDQPAWAIARGGVKSAGRLGGTILDLVTASADPGFQAMYKQDHPQANDQEIEQAWQEQYAQSHPFGEKVRQHLQDAADWLKKDSEPQGFWEKVGAVGEQMLEYVGTDGLLKMTGGGARAARAAETGTRAVQTAEDLKNAQQVATALKNNPKLAGLVSIGLKTSKEAAVMGTQTYAHTEDPRQAALAAATAGGISAVMPGVSWVAGKTAGKVLQRFAPETVEIGEQKAVPVAAKQLSKEGEILPTGTQAEPQIARQQQAAFVQHLQNSSRVAAANSLQRITDATGQLPTGPGARLQLAAPEGTQGFMFTLQGTPVTETAEGQLTHAAEAIPREATTTPAPYGNAFETTTEGGVTAQRRATGYMHPATEASAIDTRTDMEKLEGAPGPRTPVTARGEVVGGGGPVQTPDPQEAIQWRNHYERIINSPEFRELPEAQQSQMRANYDRLKNELGIYYANPHGGIVPPDVNSILQRIVSPGDAAAQIRAVNGPAYAELNRITNGRINELAEEVTDAKRIITNPDASYADKVTARKARDAANAQVNELITRHAGDTPITRQYYQAMKAGHADSVFLNNLDDEIESMTNGVTRKNTQGGKLVRVITGNTKGLEEFLSQGQNRANMERLMGPQAEENLKAFTQLLSDPGTTRKTNGVLWNIAKEVAPHMAAGSALWAPAALMGQGVKGAALGQTVAIGSFFTRQVLRWAASNPNVGRLVEYAVKNNVDSQIYAPLIARAILGPGTQK